MGCSSSTDQKAAAPAAAPAPVHKEKKIDWAILKAKLPPLDNSDESKAARKKIFSDFDINGNGKLSLAEVDKGIQDVLKVKEIMDAKPVIMRAFQAAKKAMKGKGGHDEDDYVQANEFRVLFVYLRQYYELWQMFDLLDSSDDRRIDFEEFKKAIPNLKTWGSDIQDPEAAWKLIDENGGGVVLFDEFSAWALEKRLDLVSDEEFDDPALH